MGPSFLGFLHDHLGSSCPAQNGVDQTPPPPLALLRMPPSLPPPPLPLKCVGSYGWGVLVVASFVFCALAATRVCALRLKMHH